MESVIPEPSLRAALDAKYEGLVVVSRGGGRAEFVGRDRRTGIQVGLRVIDIPEGSDPGAAVRVVQAANTARVLHHPHILRINSVAAVTDQAVVIATDYVAGQTLRDVLECRKQLSTTEAEGVLRVVAASLEFAHRTGIAHGTVNPANILFVQDETSRVMLAGFGESAAPLSPREDRSPNDRDPYLAPERHYGGVADVRSDLYSLGLIGWEMLAGVPASAAENLGELVFKQALGGSAVVARLPADTPRRVLLALEGALQWDRLLRWSGAAAFLHQLSQHVPIPEAQRRHARIVGVAPSRTSGVVAAATPAYGLVKLQQLRESSAREVTVPPSLLRRAVVRAARAARSAVPRVRYRAMARTVALPVVLLVGVGAFVLTIRKDQSWVGIVPARTTASAARDARTTVRAAPVPAPASTVARPLATAPPPVRAPVIPSRAVRLPDDARRASQPYTVGLSPAAAPPAAVSEPPASRPPAVAPTGDSALAADASRKADALGHYYRATGYLQQRTADDVYTAIDEYLAATRLDSSSARAYSGLAQAYAVVLQRGWYESAQGAALAASRGLTAADHALHLDDRYEEAWVARGTLMEFREPRSLDNTFRAYRHALLLSPRDAEALRLYARAAEYSGDFGTAEDMYRRALAHSHDSAAVLSDLADLAYLRRQFGDAKKLLVAAVTADPRNPDAYLLRVRMRLRDEEFRDAWSDAEMAARVGYPLPGAAATILVWAQMPDTAGTRERADALVRETRRKATALPVLEARYLALTLMAIGKRNGAMDVLDQAYPRGAALWLAMQDPGFQALHGQARFERLISESQATGSKSHEPSTAMKDGTPQG